MTPTPIPHTERPADHRVVPLLAEHDLGHYPEFRAFLRATFTLDDDPFGPPGLLRVGDRVYELTFVGRSGRPFPDGAEIGALVPGLEPLDESVADQDLWAILHWLVDGVGGEWTGEALSTTGRIYRIPAAALTSTDAAARADAAAPDPGSSCAATIAPS